MPNLIRHVHLRLPPSLSMTRGGRRRKLMRAAAMAAAPVALIVVAGSGAAIAGPAGGLAGTAPFPAHGAPARALAAPASSNGSHQGLGIDWALSGQASADSSQSGDPASNAIDGDAGTDWCPNAWEGTLTIDLGQARALNGIGITLDAGAPAADATIQLASSSGQWTTVPTAQNLALDAGSPMYIGVPPHTTARYAQVNVKSGTGAPVCIGEFRLFGPDPAAARMALGADLSFTPQELAAGYPATPGGQLSFVSDELSILAQVPNGLGMGLFYWSPDWIPGVGWEPGPVWGRPT